MYKVFIENKLIIFQINSQLKGGLKRKEIKQKIKDLLKSDAEELTIELKGKASFHEVFDGYKHIEAAGGVVQRDDSFMFIMRNGMWDIPKGKLEPNETPEVGAVREIEEECGVIQPKIKMHLTNTWHTYKQSSRRMLKKTYWYWLEEGEDTVDPVPQAEEGITAVEFLNWNEIDEIAEHTYASINEVIKALKEKMK